MSDINAFDLSAPQAETVVTYHDVDIVPADNPL
jgi:hypothetical protein